VAICLSALVTKLHSGKESIGLKESEKEVIKLDWYRKIVRKSELIEREFLRTIQ
jgi:tRNA (guanosine-2'-O-)-methyltransferase